MSTVLGEFQSHLSFPLKKQKTFKDLKEWSNSFNELENWTNLNALMSLSSNMETYMSSVFSLAIQSDPGVIFNSPKSIDGVFFLKHGNFNNLDINFYVTGCVKGDWNQRWANISKLYPNFPKGIFNHISELEKIRKLRNDIGHSFGKDIEYSRRHVFKTILPTSRLPQTKLIEYKNLLWRTVKEIDVYLLSNHIGEFQFINFYHAIYPNLNKAVHRNMRAVEYKKLLGSGNIAPTNKELCKKLVEYYEKI